MKSPAIFAPLLLAKTAWPIDGSGSGAQERAASSGMGFAWNNFLHWCAVHLAHAFDFLRRALSVEIPVPAYICR